MIENRLADGRNGVRDDPDEQTAVLNPPSAQRAMKLIRYQGGSDRTAFGFIAWKSREPRCEPHVTPLSSECVVQEDEGAGSLFTRHTKETASWHRWTMKAHILGLPPDSRLMTETVPVSGTLCFKKRKMIVPKVTAMFKAAGRARRCSHRRDSNSHRLGSCVLKGQPRDLTAQ